MNNWTKKSLAAMEKNQLCQALLMLSPVKLYFYQDNQSLFFD